MVKYFIAYCLTGLIFFTIDIVWLGFVAKNIYNTYLGHLLKPDINWMAGSIFYLLYIVGILIFVVYPAANKNSIGNAIIMGALFGFFAYATYDLTNLATLRDWPLAISLIDIAWGVFLTGTVSSASFFIVKFLR